MADPLTEQCTATSSRTGARCRRLVVGGGVCPSHGGKAPQVAAKRQERIELGRLRLAGVVAEDLTPPEALLAAVRDADQVRQAIRAKIAQDDGLDPDTLDLFGQWLDRAGRLSKSAIDAAAQLPPWVLLGRLEADQQASLLIAVVRATVAHLPGHFTDEQINAAMVAAFTQKEH